MEANNTTCQIPCDALKVKQGNCYCYNRDNALQNIKSQLANSDADNDQLHADSNCYRERYDNIND